MTEREEQAKAWLNRNYEEALELAAIERRIEKLQADIERCVKPLRLKEVIEGFGADNAQETKMAEYLDMSGDLGSRYMKLIGKDNETLKVINNVDSTMLRTILIERYVNRLGWNKISENVHLERSRLFDYHRQALDAVLPFIPEEAKR